MNSSAAKVGEIFREAGTAFNTLSEMTMMLQPMADTQHGGKWTDEEIDMLRSYVHRFTVDLNQLSHHIRSRTVSQIRSTLEKNAFEDAGITVRQVSSFAPRAPRAPWPKPATQVTLNMLNATEVDDELTSAVKLEFDGSTEEVAT